MLHSWNRLKDVFNDDGEPVLNIPTSIKNCPGTASVHDIQLSQIDMRFINFISQPEPVLRFDWSGKTPFIFERSTLNTIKSERDGTAQGIFMWWDLIMDIENNVTLSCAPFWAHPDVTNNVITNPRDIPWRDHWMQAVYYFPKEVPVKKGEEIFLLNCHDEYSLWFNLTKSLKLSNVDYLNPRCDCSLHIAYPRTRISQMNDAKRNKTFMRFIEKHVNSNSVVLLLSHGFYVGLASAKLGAKKVIYLDSNSQSRNLMKSFVDFNNLTNVSIVEKIENISEVLSGEKINLVLGEPYFVTSILPWDNLLFYYSLFDLQMHLSEDVTILPKKCEIMSVAVEFKDLHKIRSSLGKCEGFAMNPFDKLIEVRFTCVCLN